MKQPMSLKFKNDLHITALHMIKLYYWEILIWLLSNKNMKDLCVTFELNHLIKDPTCFISSNPSCTDNFYTNKNTMFFNSSAVETGISEHHSLICTMLRSRFCKLHENLYTRGLITTLIKNSSKIFLKRD